ncbi:hypothetical protein [Streptomyces griseosporeus]|uniref:hypothetical protein n=1 Tax=Streptomyces griseosporeus TaxID=1910 RepID=UPI0036B6B773
MPARHHDRHHDRHHEKHHARHPHRTRLLLTALAALAALTLTLTACRDGQGLRDEGPSHTGTSSAPTAP